METKVREFKQHPSGWWCYVENGRWFPFGWSKEAIEESAHRFPGDLWELGYAAFVSNDTDSETHTKMSDPKPAGLGSVGYTMTTTKYYDKKAIENLKANTSKSINFYTYVPTSFGSALVAETAPPEPPKKAMPKAVPDTNGRKFRDEE